MTSIERRRRKIRFLKAKLAVTRMGTPRNRAELKEAREDIERHGESTED